MRYQILHKESFPVVKCELNQGEILKAESDAMICMSPTLDVSSSTGGNMLEGLARRVLAGESFFFQNITASRGPGFVVLGHNAPGGIADVELDGSYKLRVQRGCFLAATSGIEIDTAVKNMVQGKNFSREGMFMLTVYGRGSVFLSSFGSVHVLTLDAGEEILVDHGNIIAWPDYMSFKIEKSSNGWMDNLASGEGFLCRFSGPGALILQTRKDSGSVTGWIKSKISAS